jgi:spore germination protein YaaH
MLIVCLVSVVCCSAASANDRPLAHFYGANDQTSWDSLRNNADSIELLSPDWFTIDQQLQLQPRVDQEIVAWAKARRIRVMPLVTNFNFDEKIAHALLLDEQRQQALIDDLVERCLNSGFWGIQLDFENVPATDRDLYSRFAGMFADELHRHKLRFSVAVPAGLQPAPPDPAHPAARLWQASEQAGGFDYRALGKLADLVTLMAYDENVSQPGPIAEIAWVEACVRDILRMVSRKKLLLGIALYYRQWSRPKHPQPNTYTISEGPYLDAFRLALHWNVRPDMDPVAQELTFAYENGDTSHVVWFSDAYTLRQRLKLVKRYRLHGSSAWRLGQEDPAAWRTAFPELHSRR